MSAIDFVNLPRRPKDWDCAIRNFKTKTLFHESVWIDFTLTARPGWTIDYFEIRRNRRTIGYHCAFRKRRLLISICPNFWFGTSAFHGPLVEDGVNQRELVSALVSSSKNRGVHVLRLRNDWLDPEIMSAHGFQVVTGRNQLCELPGDESLAWASLRGVCRTRIRKGEREGITSEVTQDPLAAERFYALYLNTLRQKGITPSFTLESYRMLLRLLVPADRLFVVCVKRGNDVIGLGFYAYDDRAMYFLDGASDPSLLHLCPNEQLHWVAMKLGIKRGIPLFNIGGGPAPSRFSQKFGGQAVAYHEFSKTLNPALALWLNACRTGSASVAWVGNAVAASGEAYP
jgi:hypothetical protein